MALIFELISGWTPLHEAVLGGYDTIAETLLKAGARVNSVGQEGITPLHDAAGLGNLKVRFCTDLLSCFLADNLCLLNHGPIFVIVL